MQEDRIEAFLSCGACGNDVSLKVDGLDTDIVRCETCGATFGKHGDVKEETMSALKAKGKNLAKTAFKKMARQLK